MLCAAELRRHRRRVSRARFYEQILHTIVCSSFSSFTTTSLCFGSMTSLLESVSNAHDVFHNVCG